MHKECVKFLFKLNGSCNYISSVFFYFPKNINAYRIYLYSCIYNIFIYLNNIKGQILLPLNMQIKVATEKFEKHPITNKIKQQKQTKSH